MAQQMLMPTPSLAKTHFDIPPNSLVTVWKTNDTQVTGQVYANPKYTGDPSMIELVNVLYVKGRTEAAGRRVPVMKIPEREIKNLQILERAPVVDREFVNPDGNKLERVVHSVNISDVQQLRKYIHAIQTYQVDKMALSFKGVNISRDGSLGWICILTEQMLMVCIDCKDKNRDDDNREWWNIIDEEILGNQNILKIVFDVRPMIDFLFHRLCLNMVNVFDVQMTDMFQQVTKHVTGAKNAPRPEPLTLSQLVEKSGIHVLPEELALLKTVESEDYSLTHPLMKRPLVHCREMKEVAISLRLLMALYKRQIDIFSSPLKECTDAQINYMKTGSFYVSYEQAVEAGNYSPEIFQVINKKLAEHYNLMPAPKPTEKEPSSSKNKSSKSKNKKK